MSDFTSNFWSVFVTTLTLVGIIACGIVLWMAGRKKVVATSDNTTGHVWDEDLVEMNNPLPRWWPTCRSWAARSSKGDRDGHHDHAHRRHAGIDGLLHRYLGVGLQGPQQGPV